jgi:hypothetical protein
MTNHHGWLLSQRVRDNPVNLLANISPSGIEENVTAKALDGGATDPSTVLVKRAQDRLYPFPIERTLWFGISTIFRIYLRVSDATTFAKSFDTFSLENQELVVNLAAPCLEVRGQRNVVIPNGIYQAYRHNMERLRLLCQGACAQASAQRDEERLSNWILAR